MLSIQSMGPGAVRYFTELAREDYYSRGGEPPGLWLGEGADRLGLSGKVHTEEFRNLFQGFSGDGLEPLVQGAGKGRHHPGWDATFSAPKSLSILWSQADPGLRAKIQQVHLGAVKDAIAYLEYAVAYTRRGKGGEITERAPGLVVAAFEHGTSRAQDPQLHTHTLILNVVPRYDGTTGTLHGIASSDPKRPSVHRLPLYEEKLTAGAMYRASLAAAIQHDIGLEIEPRKDFGFEVKGVPASLITQFSKRREAIEHELNAIGRHDAKSAQLAALITREKKAHIPREELFARWKKEGKGYHLSLNFAPNPEHELDASTSRQIAAAAAKTVGERVQVFTASEYLRSVAEHSVARGVDSRAAWRIAQDELRTLPALGQYGHRRYFTTPELAALARTVVRHLEKIDSRLQILPGSRGPAPVSERVLTQALDAMGRDGRLSQPQAQALRSLVQKRGPLRTVEGLGNLERLRVLQAARQVWEKKGYRVYAVTPNQKTARDLRSWTRIKALGAKAMARAVTKPKSHSEAFGVAISAGKEQNIMFRSIQSFLRYAESAKQTPWIRFSKKTVLIIDDPDAIHSRHLAPIVERIRKAGGTVVLASHEAQETERQAALQAEQARQAQAEQARQAQRTGPQQVQNPPQPIRQPPQQQWGRK